MTQQYVLQRTWQFQWHLNKNDDYSTFQALSLILNKIVNDMSFISAEFVIHLCFRQKVVFCSLLAAHIQLLNVQAERQILFFSTSSKKCFMFCPHSFSVHIYVSLYDKIIPVNLLSVRKLLWNKEMIKVYSRSEWSLHINNPLQYPSLDSNPCEFYKIVEEIIKILHRISQNLKQENNT